MVLGVTRVPVRVADSFARRGGASPRADRFAAARIPFPLPLTVPARADAAG